MQIWQSWLMREVYSNNCVPFLICITNWPLEGRMLNLIWTGLCGSLYYSNKRNAKRCAGYTCYVPIYSHIAHTANTHGLKQRNSIWVFWSGACKTRCIVHHHIASRVNLCTECIVQRANVVHAWSLYKPRIFAFKRCAVHIWINIYDLTKFYCVILTSWSNNRLHSLMTIEKIITL